MRRGQQPIIRGTGWVTQSSAGIHVALAWDSERPGMLLFFLFFYRGWPLHRLDSNLLRPIEG
ncbi:MAG: hypothetical protein M3R08_03830 [Bacteroidota bacterium]|nr:hypothetical protein [Bacteroidota bacterium]